MTHLCLLASGNGSRFGSNKLLADYGGKQLWKYGYEALKRAEPLTDSAVHVVSRYREILDFVGKEGIDCPESKLGISYSIRAACNACGECEKSDRILFLVADQPNISVETLAKLIDCELSECLDDGKPLAAFVFDGEKTGNPVVFSALLKDELMSLEGDNGGKSVLKKYPGRVSKIVCRAEELFDIDRPIDMKKR